MILGLVGGGMMVGLAGAIMAWLGGHPWVAVLLTYALMGSLGTMLLAAMGGMRAAGAGALRH
ncbi:MAG: hypothetical protein RLZZ437_3181 [Pseudomonadota bacterium]|jgi:hypothetical protein